LWREARALLQDDQRPIDFLRLLVERRLFVDAVRFAAHALWIRDAVWWACLCARGVERSPQENEALRTAVQWVLDPTDARRAAADEASKVVGLDSPAGCAAQAAATCLDTAHSPLSARLAGAAVLTAVVRSRLPIEAAYQQFLLFALDVFDGTASWEKPTPKPS
jgi:hypothetical protein